MVGHLVLLVSLLLGVIGGGLGMVWDGLGWFGVVWDGLGWLGDGMGMVLDQLLRGGAGVGVITIITLIK